jgi:hypothetical protein
MRKISSYLYSNRIELLADLAGFTTENKVVYQRTVKIYKGVDNVLEFDIKNADQKRLELITSPSITAIKLNVMDSAGNKLPNSPYTVTPTAGLKGIGSVTVPASDLLTIDHQFLRYSVTATKGATTIPLYSDTQFGAVGTMELVSNAMPTGGKTQVLDTFHSDLSYSSMIDEYVHSSPVLIKFYEAVPTTTAQLILSFNQLQGTVYIEATSDATISNESFPASGNPQVNPDGSKPAYRRGTVIDTFTVSKTDASATKVYSNLGNYTYLRVSYMRASVPVNGAWLPGTGSITKVVVTSPSP